MASKRVYLDFNATAPLHPAAREAMGRALNLCGNASSVHAEGRAARQLVETARAAIAGFAGVPAKGVIFTSGATEANNLIIFGRVSNPRNSLILLSGEHSSSYSPSVFLRQNGIEVDYVPLLENGMADLGALKKLVRTSTALVCFSLVNSDTGAIQDAREIVRIVKSQNPKTHVHCDAVQGFCKFDFDVEELGLDSVCISAHKIHGSKGIGAMWLKKGITLRPMMFGGSDHGFRPGTENNAGILGFAKAVEVFDTKENFEHVRKLRARLVEGLPDGVTLSTELSQMGGVPVLENPYITSLHLSGVLGSHALNALSSRGIYVGLGSACSSRATKNRTLLAMGLSERQSQQIIRVSFAHYNTPEEVDAFLKSLGEVLAELR